MYAICTSRDWGRNVGHFSLFVEPLPPGSGSFSEAKYKIAQSGCGALQLGSFYCSASRQPSTTQWQRPEPSTLLHTPTNLFTTSPPLYSSPEVIKHSFAAAAWPIHQPDLTGLDCASRAGNLRCASLLLRSLSHAELYSRGLLDRVQAANFLSTISNCLSSCSNGHHIATIDHLDQTLITFQQSDIHNVTHRHRTSIQYAWQTLRRAPPCRQQPALCSRCSSATGNIV